VTPFTNPPALAGIFFLGDMTHAYVT